MRTVRLATVALLLALTACGGDEPGVTSDEGDSVPPADAGPVEISSVGLVSASDGDRLQVDGTQPTPCHGLGWFVAAGSDPIEVTLWSEPPPPGRVCVQVIEPFSIEIDLGPLEPGTEVVLNGEVVGTVG